MAHLKQQKITKIWYYFPHAAHCLNVNVLLRGPIWRHWSALSVVEIVAKAGIDHMSITLAVFAHGCFIVKDRPTSWHRIRHVMHSTWATLAYYAPPLHVSSLVDETCRWAGRTFDLLTPKAYHFEYIPIPTPSVNTPGSFVSELRCGQTDCTEHSTQPSESAWVIINCPTPTIREILCQ